VEERPRPARQAVALRYTPGEDEAPRVTAKGRGLVADKILELARAHNVPVRQDRDLVQILSRLDLEQQIPPGVYKAVAEILAFVYRLSRQPGGQPQAGARDGRKGSP
jgi:flagellar biosynthesis protein